MRILLIAICSLCSTFSFSQSLRDSLFSGKLKADSALVAKSKIAEKKDSAKTVPAAGVKAADSDTTAVKTVPPLKPVITYADNNRIWKKFVDEQTKIIHAEVLTNRKIKKGSYAVTLEYEIGTDGAVAVKNVLCDPKNEILVDHIKERMMPAAPQLAPQIVNGAPRKSSRRQVIVFTKEKN
jgi:hypothetical protein